MNVFGFAADANAPLTSKTLATTAEAPALARNRRRKITQRCAVSWSIFSPPARRLPQSKGTTALIRSQQPEELKLSVFSKESQAIDQAIVGTMALSDSNRGDLDSEFGENTADEAIRSCAIG